MLNGFTEVIQAVGHSPPEAVCIMHAQIQREVQVFGRNKRSEGARGRKVMVLVPLLGAGIAAGRAAWQSDTVSSYRAAGRQRLTELRDQRREQTIQRQLEELTSPTGTDGNIARSGAGGSGSGLTSASRKPTSTGSMS